MNENQVLELYNAVRAVYPNSYRHMTEAEIATLLEQWHSSLAKWDYETCVEAWTRYRDGYGMRDLNLSVFAGVCRDVVEERKREEKRNKPLPKPIEEDENTRQAREACMAKCRELFNWTGGTHE